MPQTRVVKIDAENPKEKLIKEAAEIILQGGLVVFPTETVYGLGGNFFDKSAVERIYEIKKRPRTKPLTLHIANSNIIENMGCALTSGSRALFDKFWPGPLTVILKCQSGQKLGFRMPRNIVALKLIEKSGVPIVAPSANISGAKPPTSAEAALGYLNGLVELVLDAGKTTIGVESTVIDFSESPYKILRQGAINEAEINSALKQIRPKSILFVCTGNTCRSVMAKGLLEKALKDKKISDIKIMSAGIAAFIGTAPTAETQEVMNSAGIDVKGEKSKNVTKELVNAADIILTMSYAHKFEITRKFPEAKEKVYLLADYVSKEKPINAADKEIPDPIGRAIDFYKNVFGMIKDYIDKLVGMFDN